MKTIAIVDDHKLVSNSLKNLIQSFGNYSVIYQVSNGKQLIDQFDQKSHPDLILLDINMPIMNGIQTMEWLHTNHPQQKVLALSMDDDENTIITMLKFGACGYILKDMDPDEFKLALVEIFSKGHYYTEKVTKSLITNLNNTDKDKLENLLSDREVEFLNLACSEKTYKQVAETMFLSPKTIDGYRESIFQKFGVKSRVGMVMFAIKNGLVKL